ncbi:MAG: phenylalanine--tRNA ligase subunit alpha [Deltaproteobacteria bacterium]|nr:phenylalanine--tRNA ligase subunit alpha [Deltaproteobacteria bacterium]MCL5792271.1 phenylalanine--tRNA ligase subunit alpha [Deltaproteobacteria bacterium]
MTTLKELIDKLDSIGSDAEQALLAIENLEQLESFRIKYLGRSSGALTALFKQMSGLTDEEMPVFGKKANQLKQFIQSLYEDRHELITHKLDGESDLPSIDITLPGRSIRKGHTHPITKAMNEIISIFTSMGFQTVDGPEIELDYYNFEALNMPKEHPARDMQDTFYFPDGFLLRTQTSPVQIRTMETKKPPVSVIAPGRVFRRDWDITHTPMFHQVEGLLVDNGISMANLKGVLEEFLIGFFGKDTKVRFRPSYFPFTEPSVEVDIGCLLCNGDGCRVCKGTGWLEVLGAGMVHPEVLRRVKYDASTYTGFAFGMGVERLAMLKYNINDLRLFFENDLRFLRQ